MSGDLLPFSAVVGQEDAKLALLLNACDRRIGGVLLRGDKGTAKTTLARGLAALLGDGAPFVELPVGATEDRVVGTLDLAAALTGGEKRFDPGLLHAAHRGVLYVDEINLLPDHLVDVLLDVAATGVNRIEREGMSHSHPSRFLLVGSMNPEEGDLRPQLLDRFGLAVDILTPSDLAVRSAALQRRLAFDSDAERIRAQFGPLDADLAARLAGTRPARLPDRLVEAVSALCASVGAEGLRADLTICRAAAALAGWERREEVSPGDVRRVAPLALAHRARRDPFDPAGMDQPQMEQALDETLGPPDGGAGETVHDPTPVRVPPAAARVDRSRSAPATGRRTDALGPRGRMIGDRAPDGPVSSVAVAATVRQAAGRPRDPGSRVVVEARDVRQAIHQHRSANLIVMAVDASGSMGARQRMETAKGAVMALLRDAYQRRDLVSLVSFRGDGAEVLLRPTGSVEVARARLAELPTGGQTPLAAGLLTALEVATSPGRAASYFPLIVVITDARATSGPDAVESATAAAGLVRRSGVTAVVIDVEGAGGGNGTRLGLAADLASTMGASYVSVTDLTAGEVERIVRETVASDRR